MSPLFIQTRTDMAAAVRLLILVVWLSVGGCAVPTPPPAGLLRETQPVATVTRTPFQPLLFTLTPSITPSPTPSQTPTLLPHPGIFAGPEVPEGLLQGVVLPQNWEWRSRAEEADVRIVEGGGNALWIYVLAAPFPTVTDGIRLNELHRAWRGEYLAQSGGQPLLVDSSTLAVFRAWWGPPAQDAVLETPPEEMLALAWKTHAWAIIPFERLEPGWKVISLDGITPLSRGELKNYPLTFGFQLEGARVADFTDLHGILPSTNRDPGQMTTLLMTGTTALTRAVGYKMETNGLDYPGEDIRAWLQDADFTHLSNESSFIPTCPPANPNQTSLMFCSRPEYIRLFESVGANIIELSGNHNTDWGREAFSLTLDMFRQRGWKWFAGGENAEQARQPLLLEHHGNRIALIGCNFAGPPTVWATANEVGAAHCNLDWLDGELGRLRADGYLVVMTFQYNEIYQMKPSEGQARDFRRALAAGATIVSGSQAHFPQTYEFQSSGFIHYGLGNLFFDQMDIPVEGTRRELLDLHVFYAGRHISTVIRTAMLEDYARPRPMTVEERTHFLQDIFRASGW